MGVIPRLRASSNLPVFEYSTATAVGFLGFQEAIPGIGLLVVKTRHKLLPAATVITEVAGIGTALVWSNKPKVPDSSKVRVKFLNKVPDAI